MGAASMLKRGPGSTDSLGMVDEVRSVVGAHARLSVDVSAMAADADLYQAGMTSHASVNVMLALEDNFDIEFPDRMLKRDVFESIASITTAIEELRAESGQS